MRFIVIFNFVLIGFFGSAAAFAGVKSCSQIPEDLSEIDVGSKCKTSKGYIFERVEMPQPADESLPPEEMRGWKGPDNVVWLDRIMGWGVFHDGPARESRHHRNAAVIFGSPANLLCEDIGAELPEREDVIKAERFGFREVTFSTGEEVEIYQFWVANWGLNTINRNAGNGMYYRIDLHDFYVGMESECYNNGTELRCTRTGRPVRCIYR
jgi:hypothetical protein